MPDERRVLLLNHTGAESGAERSLAELAVGLRDAGVNTLVVTPSGRTSSRLVAESVPCVPIADPLGGTGFRRIGRWIRSARDVRRAVRAWKPTVIHANSPKAGFLACLAGVPGPLVVHVRDDHYSPLLRRVGFPLLRRRASLMIAVSGHTAKRVERHAGSVPIGVYYCSFDEELRPPTPSERQQARARWGLDDACLAVVHVGQLAEWKQQDVSIRAAASARRATGVDVRLLVAGGSVDLDERTRRANAEFAAYLRQVVEEEDGVLVRFLGPVADVRSLFWAADVAVVPSRDEPFGRVVVEGMACGVCTLATSVGGPAEIVESGVSGVTVEPSSDAFSAALSTLVGDEALRGALARGGVQRADRFRSAGRVPELLRLYAERGI